MLQALGPGHHPLGLKKKADSREFSWNRLPLGQAVDEDRNDPGRQAKRKKD